jgi:hypothetical protein
MVQKFLEKEGQRVFYLAVATIIGIAFISLGLKEEGIMFLTAVGTLALNRARGSEG